MPHATTPPPTFSAGRLNSTGTPAPARAGAAPTASAGASSLAGQVQTNGNGLPAQLQTRGRGPVQTAPRNTHNLTPPPGTGRVYRYILPAPSPASTSISTDGVNNTTTSITVPTASTSSIAANGTPGISGTAATNGTDAFVSGNVNGTGPRTANQANEHRSNGSTTNR